MMVGPFILVYLSAGVITAVVTLILFPPEHGYQPGVALQLFAVTLFVALWPFLVGLGLWCQLRQCVRRFLHDEQPSFAVSRRISVAKPK